MPRGKWHANVKRWWQSVWRSPMAGEFTEADKRGLEQLLVIEQDFWEARTPEERRRISAELRLARQEYGLTPIARRRLQWEIERAESAEERTKGRRKRKDTRKKQKEAANDPRRGLRVV